MDYSDDGDLLNKITQYRKLHRVFDEQFIFYVMIQILIGLKKLHELNVVHRDIKVSIIL